MANRLTEYAVVAIAAAVAASVADRLTDWPGLAVYAAVYLGWL